MGFLAHLPQSLDKNHPTPTRLVLLYSGTLLRSPYRSLPRVQSEIFSCIVPPITPSLSGDNSQYIQHFEQQNGILIAQGITLRTKFVDNTENTFSRIYKLRIPAKLINSNQILISCGDFTYGYGFELLVT